MNQSVIRTAAVTLLAMGLAACGTTHGGSPISPPPAADAEGQIMSVTGDGFTLCGISNTATPAGRHYRVDVCGDTAKAYAALEQRFPGLTDVHTYQPDEGGKHTPQQLVTRYWVNRTTGDGFTITSTRITSDGTIAVGVDGDLDKARSVLNKQFPNWTTVHAEASSNPL
ncbi:hypothetical protein ACFYST_32105 [Kitasatospora sp. NPDC004614]|uniref:hypothetical protein n=1 Tax=unclassified Kitasatospora TaxID=2633591 RepID=UPI00368FF138